MVYRPRIEVHIELKPLMRASVLSEYQLPEDNAGLYQIIKLSTLLSYTEAFQLANE